MPARLAASVLGVIGVAAIAAPWLAPHDPLGVDLANNYAAVSWLHPLGTDHLGRDTFSRLLFGARTSLGISVVSVGAALIAGSVLGLAGAWRRGWIDAVVGQIVDVLLAFPDILLAIAIVAILGRGSGATMAAVAVFSLPTFARIVRAAALSAVSRDYVDAARAAGAATPRILVMHVLPACLSPIVAQAAVMLGTAILVASGLSYLGLGVQPPDPEWGAMLSRGRELLQTAPLGAIAPGVAITIVVLSFSVLGDAIRDALDPRTTRNTRDLR